MDRSRLEKSVARTFLLSPLAVVLATAMLVVFALSFAGYVRRGGFWSPVVEARVFNDGRRTGGQGEGAVRNGERRFPFQGEVYSQAEQLRESSALAMGTILLALTQAAEGKPFRTVEELLAGVVVGGLLPPGLKPLGGDSGFNSEQAVYYIRYRADPLGVEVLSIGKGTSTAFMVVRLPDDEFAENALTYYITQKAGTQMPGAFLRPVQLIGAGWHPEVFKAAQVSSEELQKQREWLAARGQVVNR